MWFYDNPDTELRECYAFGHAVGFFSPVQLRFAQSVPLALLDVWNEAQKLGPFQEGQSYGRESDKPNRDLSDVPSPALGPDGVQYKRT